MVSSPSRKRISAEQKAGNQGCPAPRSGVALDCRLGSAIEIPATRNEYIPGAYWLFFCCTVWWRDGGLSPVFMLMSLFCLFIKKFPPKPTIPTTSLLVEPKTHHPTRHQPTTNPPPTHHRLSCKIASVCLFVWWRGDDFFLIFVLIFIFCLFSKKFPKKTFTLFTTLLVDTKSVHQIVTNPSQKVHLIG